MFTVILTLVGGVPGSAQASKPAEDGKWPMPGEIPGEAAHTS